MSFTVNGCRVSVSFLFVAAFTFLLFADSTGAAVAGLVAAAVHELGHLMIMALFHCVPQQVRCGVFGVDIVKRSDVRRGYGKEALISLAGPAVNLVTAGILALVHNPLFDGFLAANLLLAGVNLLPIESLDGGQALYAVLCLRFKEQTAAAAVRAVSFAALIPLAAAGFLLLLRSHYNFSLLFLSLYLMFFLVFKKGDSQG